MKAFFKDRYDTSHQAGVEKLKYGTIPLFSGVSEVLRNDMIVAVKLKDLNAWLSQLLRDLGRLEDRNCYSFFMARRDFSHHVTIQVATGGHGAQAELELGRDYLAGNILTFNRLVLDGGGNIVLMNEGVPQAVSEWRGWATQVMTEYGGVPKPLPIFHSTVARIQRFNYSIAAADWLIKVVEGWNDLLQKQPIEFVPESTFVGTTYDLLTI